MPLYQQKMQAQLDEWKAEVDKLKAQVSGASANIQLEINEEIKGLETKIKVGKSKMLNSRKQVKKQGMLSKRVWSPHGIQ